MGEQAIDDQCVETYDDGRCSDNDEAQLRDGYTFGIGEGIMERRIGQRERLVERMDFVDDVEDYDETTVTLLLACSA